MRLIIKPKKPAVLAFARFESVGILSFFAAYFRPLLGILCMEALPYLQKVTLKREHVFSFDTYPFSIPAVNQLFEIDFSNMSQYL